MNSTKVSRELWQERMGNLMARRALGTKGLSVEAERIGDYAAHFKKIFIGKTVLDVGCGGMGAAKFLTPEIQYTGIDAFPIRPQVIKMEVEQMTFEDQSFETLFCFAVLDGVCDLVKAIEQMKRVCKCNIVFLTGFNIEPDQYHTYKIIESELTAKFSPEFEVGYKEYFFPVANPVNVALIEYKRK